MGGGIIVSREYSGLHCRSTRNESSFPSEIGSVGNACNYHHNSLDVAIATAVSKQYPINFSRDLAFIEKSTPKYPNKGN